MYNILVKNDGYIDTIENPTIPTITTGMSLVSLADNHELIPIIYSNLNSFRFINTDTLEYELVEIEIPYVKTEMDIIKENIAILYADNLRRDGII